MPQWSEKSEKSGQTGAFRHGTLTSRSTQPIQGQMMLISVDDVLAKPRGLHSLLLRLVGDLSNRLGEPVLHETLQWYSDAVDDAVAHEPIESLRDQLGPRPRRTNLVVALGDLVDMGLLVQQPRGFNVSALGWDVLKHLEQAEAPNFEALVGTYS